MDNRAVVRIVDGGYSMVVDGCIRFFSSETYTRNDMIAQCYLTGRVNILWLS